MKIHTWHYLNRLTDNWHDGGALVIITDRDYEDAWSYYLASTDDPRGHIRTKIDKEPDSTYNVDATEERVFVYEDAGCC